MSDRPDRSIPWRRLGFEDEGDLAVWADYIRKVADLMELRDWSIIAHHAEPDDATARAQVNPTYGRKIATIRWCDRLKAEAPIIVRQALVHELVHLHVEQVAEAVEGHNGGDGLFNELGGPAYRAFYSHFHVAMERAVDGLADAIAPSIPLIEWGRDRHTAASTEFWLDDGRVMVHPYREERPREGVVSAERGHPLDPPATGAQASPGALSRRES